MAVQDISVPAMDDRELFQGAMADEPAPAEAPVTEAQPETPVEQPRDDQGRFAPKTEAPADPAKPAVEALAQPDNKDDQAGQVPSWRLREVREAREAAEKRAVEADQQRYALEQQLADMRNKLGALEKPKTEPIDFFQDPEGAMAQRLSPMEERFNALAMELRLDSSRAVALATHGKEAVKEMDEAVAKAMRENHPDIPQLRAQLQASRDPVNVAMQWHMRSKIMEQIGPSGDLNAYVEKLIEERAKDPKHQAKVMENARAQAGAAPTGSPSIQLPPSLNKAPGSSANNAAEAFTDADMSDQNLFRHAMSSR